jgi:hypothetical protein
MQQQIQCARSVARSNFPETECPAPSKNEEARDFTIVVGCDL